MILGMFYRYWILLPMINIRVHWFYYVALPILHYIVGGCGCGICAVYSILDDESTEALFLEASNPYGMSNNVWIFCRKSQTRHTLKDQ